MLAPHASARLVLVWSCFQWKVKDTRQHGAITTGTSMAVSCYSFIVVAGLLLLISSTWNRDTIKMMLLVEDGTFNPPHPPRPQRFFFSHFFFIIVTRTHPICYGNHSDIFLCDGRWSIVFCFRGWFYEQSLIYSASCMRDGHFFIVREWNISCVMQAFFAIVTL